MDWQGYIAKVVREGYEGNNLPMARDVAYAYIKAHPNCYYADIVHHVELVTGMEHTAVESHLGGELNTLEKRGCITSVKVNGHLKTYS